MPSTGCAVGLGGARDVEPGCGERRAGEVWRGDVDDRVADAVERGGVSAVGDLVSVDDRRFRIHEHVDGDERRVLRVGFDDDLVLAAEGEPEVHLAHDRVVVLIGHRELPPAASHI